MASVVITIDTGGAAFHGERDDFEHPEWTPVVREVLRVLDIIRVRFEYERDIYETTVRNANGESCGKVEIID